MITKDILIEDLVTMLPESIGYLMKSGIKCIACGEPIWGTLEQAAREKSFSDQQIERFVIDLREMAASRQSVQR